jgi:predicted nucleotidyltransferase
MKYMENKELNNFINEFCNIDGIQALVLGGSRTTERMDEKSDYDFYVYSENGIDQEIRHKILSKYCKYFEIGNSYWELEDNGQLNCGIDFDLVYRNLQQFTKTVADVVENYNSYNGYTTCMWHNILNSKIIFDKNDVFKKIKERFSIPYPKKLKENIIIRNMALLSDSVVSYDRQIMKSIYRKDLVNLNNRVSAFLASYFDVIFAINELPNPGEKHLMEICLNKCNVLPSGFERNVNSLIQNMSDESKIPETINSIIHELKKIL